MPLQVVNVPLQVVTVPLQVVNVPLQVVNVPLQVAMLTATPRMKPCGKGVSVLTMEHAHK